MEKKTREQLLTLMKEVPIEMRKRLYKDEYVTPTALHIAQTALKDKGISAEKKRKVKKILDSGLLSKKRRVINLKVAKEIDDFLDNRLSALIKSGTIKDPKQDTEINEFKRKHRE